MDTTSNPITGGLTAKTSVAIRIGAAALLIAAGFGILGVYGASAGAVDEPYPAVQTGARPAQFR